MNLYSLVNNSIAQVSPNHNVTLKIFNGTTIGYGGIVSASYTDVVVSRVQIHLENNQKLEHKRYYQLNQIYKAFYMTRNNLTGLSRQLQTNGDLIVYKTITYKIVEVIDDFETGYVCVIGCEGNDANVN